MAIGCLDLGIHIRWKNHPTLGYGYAAGGHFFADIYHTASAVFV
ncbi:hypothetical protein MCC93_10210 [Morococcus cerebrosus]|uniref:Uncharacterized protein n=1 Tax=Morococcus cerebrosus TaxID=1056807 RepID=A0A0C1GV10_9NEIS|nr:hypothetical protein MCC93_10210 [Morococcus cerebrosus]